MFLSEYLDHTLKKLKSHIANLLTLGNLTLGAFSVISTMKNQLELALLLIFIAALTDRLDGIAARKLRIESEFGKQFDSMSDIISFGIAPSLLLYQGLLFEFGPAGAFFTILYIACGAIRLARYNISDHHGFFTGLPITVAGTLLTLSYLMDHIFSPQFYMFFILTLSLLMISTFKVKRI